jgi:hypothetical protein
MTKRKSPTPNLYREICMRQIAAGHVVNVGGGSYRMACPGCGNALDLLSKMIREHVIALARGGADDATNQFFWHEECSKRKTFGNGATTSGSDIGEIAKTKRLEKAREAMESGVPKKPKRKIQNKGWDKRYRKKMSGEVVSRD